MNIIDAIIQAIWLIDEYAIILRKLVWFIPIIPLIIIEVTIIIDIKLIILILYISNTIGAIFCQVSIIKQFIHLSPSITSGNQK